MDISDWEAGAGEVVRREGGFDSPVDGDDPLIGDVGLLTDGATLESFLVNSLTKSSILVVFCP